MGWHGGGYPPGMTSADVTPTPDQSPTPRPLAAITGASSGIGLELAKQFVQHDFDVVVCAEDDELHRAAEELRAGGAHVTTVQTDLRRPAGVEELWAAITAEGRPLAAIALNAGVGQGGAFIDNDLADEQSIIDLNVSSTVHLAKLALREMVAADAGRVLVTSSIASTMPGAYQAIYNASKSFLQSFAEAVQQELTDTAVTITSLMPGPTETEFFERGDLEDTKMGQSKHDDPAQVAAQGFEALMSGEAKVVGGGLRTRAQEAVTGVLPDKVKAAMHASMAEPGSGD